MKIYGDFTISNLIEPFIVILTNEAQQFSTDSSRVVTGAQSYYTEIIVYQGATQRTDFLIGNISSANGITVSRSAPRVTFSVKENATITSDTGSFVIPVTLDGQTVEKVFSWSCAKQGISGTDGLDAKYVDIICSSQVFKSTDGGTTFGPDIIKLTPVFQGGLTYSKWQYSVNGGTTWLNIVSGNNGLTITSGILTIAKTCNLFTDTITSISFKCISSDSKYYDIVTILKLYDVTDLTDDLEEIRKISEGAALLADTANQKIEGKVWQDDTITVVDKDGNEVQKSIKNILIQTTADINGITNTVSDIQTDLDVNADGSVAHTLNERIAKAEQDASGFKQTVSEKYSTKEETKEVQSTLEQRAGKIEGSVKDLGGNVSTLTTDLEGITGRVKDAEGNIAQVKETAKGIETEIRSATGEGSTLKQKFDGMVSEVIGSDGFNTAIEQKTNEIKQTVQKKQDIPITAVRYIRDWLNGSSIDSDDRWVECKVMVASNEEVPVTEEGSNETVTVIKYADVAEGLIPICKDNSLKDITVTSPDIYTDGLLLPDSSNQYYISSTGEKCMQLDLGAVRHDIDYIHIWHYYLDNRVYNHKLQVSSDGVTWITIYDSNISGGYAEDEDGRVHYLSNASIVSGISNINQSVGKIQSSVSEINGKMSNVTQTVEDISGTVTNNKNALENFDKAFSDLGKEIQKQNKANAESFASLKIGLGEITNRVAQTEDDITEMSQSIQDASGWQYYIAQLGMTDENGDKISEDIITNVSIDINGITVTNPKTGQITKMQIDGFKGYYNDDVNPIFWIERDTTKTKRLLCEKGWDTDFIKMTTNEYIYTDGRKLKGTAYVKSGGSS